MSENKGDTELIRKLKEQVHKSFMQVPLPLIQIS